MDESERERDLRDVMATERQRGSRRPTAGRAAREQQQKLIAIRKYLQLPTEDKFVEAMRDEIGLNEEHEEFWDALQAWRDYRD
jgi:hypothetical protein